MPTLDKSSIKNKTRTGDVKETLLDWIRQGKFPSGTALPSVPELVTRLGVSRTVIREALQSLVGMNFIEMRPGLGSYVKAVLPNLIVNADVMAALIDFDTLIKVAIARKAIEGSVARVAATQARTENYEEMELVLDKIRRFTRRNQPMYNITPEFHIAVAKATQNQVLEGVVTSFNSLMVTAGEVIEKDEIGYEYRMGEYSSHLKLYDVLRTRDPLTAQVAMEEHIEKTVQVLERVRTRALNASS